ncbi:MAG TPA: secretion system protein E, partial [Methanocorpusculum sp.]|nr:secretion system protein E [Methanocorpusculum sp.]
LSTFHAGNLRNAINRLENPPLSVPRAMISSLDIILTQKRIVKDGEQIRRITDIEEISDGIELNTNKVFSYVEKDDNAVFSGFSEVYYDILSHTGMTKDEFEAEAERRRKLLLDMVEAGISDFQTVSSVISEYMTGE